MPRNQSFRAGNLTKDGNTEPETPYSTIQNITVDYITVENTPKWGGFGCRHPVIPIWHGQSLRILYTFLENYYFTDKKILPFCTSGSSGIGSNAENLHSLSENADWLDGKRLPSDTTKDEMALWLEDNGIHPTDSAKTGVFDFDSRTVLLNSGYKMPINRLGTYSLHGNECVNSVKAAIESGVRLIDTASSYGNEAEVCQAIREEIDSGTIKREDVFVITKIYPGSEM